MTEVLSKIKEYHADPTQFYTEIEVKNDSTSTLEYETIRVPFIRQSERRAFKSCQYQWDWAWNQGFTPAMQKQDARWFGTGLHLCLAEHYVLGTKRGKDMHTTWDEFTADNYTRIATGPYFDNVEWVDAKALGHEMITNYYKEYGNDSEWEVIAVEQRYRYKVKTDNGVILGVLVGTFDAVLRNRKTNEVWMIDHKTERARINMNHLVKDEQAGTYVSIATLVLRAQGKIGPKEVVRGIIYNFLRKAYADDRPRNDRNVYCNKPTKVHYEAALSHIVGFNSKMKVDDMADFAARAGITVFGEESKNQPAPLFARDFVIRNTFERQRQIQRVGEELQQMSALRNGLLPLTKAPGDHCGWCDFKDLCDIDEQGGDVESYARAGFRQRDPYADHRAGAANSKTSVKADEAAKKKARAF